MTGEAFLSHPGIATFDRHVQVVLGLATLLADMVMLRRDAEKESTTVTVSWFSHPQKIYK